MTTRPSPRILSTAALLSTLAFSSGAFAGDVALAESLFRQGRELMEKGDVAAACPKLSESFLQDESTGTLLALALCQEQAGQTASAWANFAAVIPRARRDGRQDREQAAREHMDALDPKLSRLAITVEAATASLPGLVVKRDGLVLGAGAWGAPSPVDPGEHKVEASAPGKLPWVGKITIGANADSQNLAVPALLDEPPGSTTPDGIPGTGDAGVTSDGAVPAKGLPLRTIGIVVGGVGLVGLGVSGFFGLRAKNFNEESKSADCDASNVCGPTGQAKRDNAISAAGVATITLIAGGVLTAAGVTLFIVGGPKKEHTESARVEATPAVGPGFSGMLVRGQF